MTVLDASALLAFLFRESGHEPVAGVIDDCCMSTVNLSEVLGRFARDGHDPRDAAERIAASPIETVPFVEDHAALTAALLPRTADNGLSLADRACLALAIQRQIPVMTADRAWSDIELPIPVVQIRS